MFDSLVYVHVSKEKRWKLDAKVEKCILIGYSDEKMRYKCYNPQTKQARISHDVILDESVSWYVPWLQPDNSILMPPEEEEIKALEESLT